MSSKIVVPSKNREINNKITERFSPAELASFLKALEEEPPANQKLLPHGIAYRHEKKRDM